MSLQNENPLSKLDIANAMAQLNLLITEEEL